MLTIETMAEISKEGVLYLKMPQSIKPGKHKIVVVIDEGASFPHQKASAFLPVHDVGPWPKNLSLHRVDIYEDDE